MDLNHWPSGYEPNELPDCSTPRVLIINYTFSEKILSIKKKILAREVAKLVVVLYSQSCYCVNIHEDCSSVIF